MISAWESLHFATLELVRSTPLKQRLVCAYRRHLATLPVDQLPVEVRESFQYVMATLQGSVPLPGEDAVSASVRKLSMQEADECSALLVEIYGVTCRALLDRVRPATTVAPLRGVELDDGEYRESPRIERV